MRPDATIESFENVLSRMTPVDCAAHIACTWHAHVQYFAGWLGVVLRSDDSLSFAELLQTIGCESAIYS